MTPPRLFLRDGRYRALRLALALLLSVAAHLALIFGVRGALPATAVSQSRWPLEARLVPDRAASATESQPQSLVEPVAPAKARPERKAAAAELPSAKPARPSQTPPSPALPLPFDPVFYTWREVDVTAKLKGSSNPPYPKEAQEAGLGGRVLIEVWVNEAGRVDDAQVIEAEPPGHFEEATLRHYRTLTFSPAMKDGKPKRFRARFVVEFDDPARAAEPR